MPVPATLFCLFLLHCFVCSCYIVLPVPATLFCLFLLHCFACSCYIVLPVPATLFFLFLLHCFACSKPGRTVIPSDNVIKMIKTDIVGFFYWYYMIMSQCYSTSRWPLIFNIRASTSTLNISLDEIKGKIYKLLIKLT